MSFVPSFVDFAFPSVIVLFLSLSPCDGNIACCPSALTTVSVNSSLPLEGSPGVGVKVSLFKSYNGTYLFELSSWKELSLESNVLIYGMAAPVRNTEISAGSQIWAANNAIVLEAANGSSLKLSEEGEFSLQFNGNNTVWHTKAGVTDSGSDFSTAGKYGMEMNEHSRLVMYANANGSQFVYWSFGIVSNSNKTADYVAIEDAVMFYDNQNIVVGEISPIFNTSLQRGTIRIVFNQSSNLLAFARLIDTWTLFYHSSISACKNPAYCENHAEA